MRVLVLGGGVIGVTSAWYLAKAGHNVTVIDRQPGCGLETSFGNAGMISPGYSAPWAAPGIPFKALKWMLSEHSPMALKLTTDPFQYLWMTKVLLNCTSQRYSVNKERMMRLAEYSRDCLIALREETSIDYEGRQLGTLQLFRKQEQIDAAAKDIEILKRCDVPYQVLSKDELIDAEPGLASSAHKLVGGLRLPNDETGDCYLFTTRLADRCAELGVEFLYNYQVEDVLTNNGRVIGVSTSQGVIQADCCVMALGSYSRKMLLEHGIDLPIYPVKGYSLTLPVVNSNLAPVSTVMDEIYKVAITRFADRIRVGGMAELAGYDYNLKNKHRKTLEMVVGDLYPQGGDINQGRFWMGFRPMTPDGTPIIGATEIENLYINSGHGTLGWTMACGSGQLLADLVSGKETDIHTDGFGIDRYQ